MRPHSLLRRAEYRVGGELYTGKINSGAVRQFVEVVTNGISHANYPCINPQKRAAKMILNYACGNGTLSP